MIASGKTVHAGQSGFTLVELLVAVVLLGMLSLLLFGGLRFGTRAWESATNGDTGTNRVRAAQDAVAFELKGIYPFFVLASMSSRYVQFDGGPAAMTFFAPSPDDDGNLNVETLSLDSDGTLALNTRPELGLNRTATATHRALIRGVAALDIAYFGALAPGAPPRWQSIWRNASTLPSLIRVRVTMHDEAVKWPDLVIEPHLSVDESCVYTGLSKYCMGRL
jgi:general secretion pathway protein J